MFTKLTKLSNTTITVSVLLRHSSILVHICISNYMLFFSSDIHINSVAYSPTTCSHMSIWPQLMEE